MNSKRYADLILILNVAVDIIENENDINDICFKNRDLYKNKINEILSDLYAFYYLDVKKRGR